MADPDRVHPECELSKAIGAFQMALLAAGAATGVAEAPVAPVAAGAGAPSPALHGAELEDENQHGTAAAAAALAEEDEEDDVNDEVDVDDEAAMDLWYDEAVLEDEVEQHTGGDGGGEGGGEGGGDETAIPTKERETPKKAEKDKKAKKAKKAQEAQVQEIQEAYGQEASSMIPPEARCWFRKELEECKALKVVTIPADHNCLFHALAYHLSPLGHEVVRKMVCDELALDPGQRYSEAFAPGEDNLNEDASFNAYVTRMRQDSEWGGDHELNAAASKFNLKIHIHGQGPETVIEHESTDGPAKVVHVVFYGDHYDVALPITHELDTGAVDETAGEQASGAAEALSVVAHQPHRTATLFHRMGQVELWRHHGEMDGEDALAPGAYTFEQQRWVRIGPSPLCKGDGLFADRTFKAKDLIIRYGGESCTAEQVPASVHVFQARDGQCIDGAKSGIAARINWSKNPNAQLRESGGVYAKRCISVEEEITIAYGSTYWKVHEKEPVRAAEGAPPPSPAEERRAGAEAERAEAGAKSAKDAEARKRNLANPKVQPANPKVPWRETVKKRQELMEQLEPCQQLLMHGVLHEKANPTVWSNFGTLTNGQLEIRQSKVKRIIEDNVLGRGLFARREYAVDEIITVYGGELITQEEAKRRTDACESRSRRYLMRISDSDFLVDGWQFASGISDTPGPDGSFLPMSEDATQWTQGCASMVNHDPANHNACLSFLALDARSEAMRLYPRIPVLRALRRISPGDEILFNYGSSMPFRTAEGTVSGKKRSAAVTAKGVTPAAPASSSTAPAMQDIVQDLLACLNVPPDLSSEQLVELQGLLKGGVEVCLEEASSLVSAAKKAKKIGEEPEAPLAQSSSMAPLAQSSSQHLLLPPSQSPPSPPKMDKRRDKQEEHDALLRSAEAKLRIFKCFDTACAYPTWLESAYLSWPEITELAIRAGVAHAPKKSMVSVLRGTDWIEALMEQIRRPPG